MEVGADHVHGERADMQLVLRQVRKKSFWNYVQANLDAHNIRAWPVF